MRKTLARIQVRDGDSLFSFPQSIRPLSSRQSISPAHHADLIKRFGGEVSIPGIQVDDMVRRILYYLVVLVTDRTLIRTHLLSYLSGWPQTTEI